MIERRSAPRLAVRFDVDITHPSFGTRRTRAENLSDGGLLVADTDLPLRVGARVTVRAVIDSPLDGRSPPAVQMDVRHRSSHGIGLAFATRAAEHLWLAARQALAPIGTADFALRVYHALALTNEHAVLLVRGASRWAFPGAFVSDPGSYREHLRKLAREQLAIDLDPAGAGPVEVAVAPGSPPLYVVYFRCPVGVAANALTLSKAWRDHRWIRRRSELEHVEVADPMVRAVARHLLSDASAA